MFYVGGANIGFYLQVLFLFADTAVILESSSIGLDDWL